MPPETLRGHDKAIDELTVRGIVDSQGGVEGLVEKMNGFHEVVDLMRRERARLMDEYPDQWVAMSKDGVVVAGDSIDCVLKKADARGMKRGELVIEFLDTDPPLLIL